MTHINIKDKTTKRGCIKIPIHPLFISIGKECI